MYTKPLIIHISKEDLIAAKMLCGSGCRCECQCECNANDECRCDSQCLPD